MAKSVFAAPHFHNEEAAFEHVEAALWPNGPVCPHCGNCDAERIGRLQGKSSRVGLRKCYACRGTFTVRMGSIFEDSHLALHLWLQVIHLMCASKKGISTRQIQRMLLCSMKTAWFLTHRIREAMAATPDDPMGGFGQLIEVDETYVGGKAANKHKGKRVPGRGPTGKEAVVTIIERGGRSRSFHVANVKANTLGPVLYAMIDRQSTLMTDESPIYRPIGREFAVHALVNHGADEYVRPGNLHTNTVENFFSIFKRGITGCYFQVSEAHLHRYLAEFDFRYSNREKLGIDDAARADLALRGAKGKRLTYQKASRQAA